MCVSESGVANGTSWVAMRRRVLLKCQCGAEEGLFLQHNGRLFETFFPFLLVQTGIRFVCSSKLYEPCKLRVCGLVINTDLINFKWLWSIFEYNL